MFFFFLFFFHQDLYPRPDIITLLRCFAELDSFISTASKLHALPRRCLLSTLRMKQITALDATNTSVLLHCLINEGSNYLWHLSLFKKISLHF